jgi:hypothetical protein
MTREVAALRRSIWQNVAGCECPSSLSVEGRIVATRRDEVCSREAVRCNGRMRRICTDFKRHGLKLGPVRAGESGLVGNRKAPRVPPSTKEET